MGSSKRRIRIADTKKFIRLVAGVLAIAVVITVLCIKPWQDTVEKQIEKAVGSNIKIIRTYIAAYDSDNKDISDNTVYNTLNEKNTVKFKVIYNYQTESGTVANYPVTEGVSVSVSDTAYATIMEDGSIIIPNGLTSDYELTVTVQYKKLTQEYKYIIKAGNPVPSVPNSDTENE